jgi:uncharacterized repeat protein (TIGR01451 family)
MRKQTNKNKGLKQDKAHLSFLVIGALFLSAFLPAVFGQTESSTAVKDQVSEVAQAVQINEAQAAQGGPSLFQIAVQDDNGNSGNCSQQYADYGSALYSPPSGYDYGYVTDGNRKDPNCAKIRMDAGDNTISNGSMYTSDFRIGIALAESESGCADRRSATSWTGWASEGGGSAFTYASGSINAADCVWIFYETRPIPNGAIRIIDAQAGIGVGNGGWQFTPWASQGGGWAPGWSTTSGKDFTTARIALNTRLNFKYNADYVSSTIPQYPPTTLSIGYSGQHSVTMKNIPDIGASNAMPWTSDVEVSSTTNRGVARCDEWVPTGPSETCTQTTVYSSSKFKLRRIDSNTGAVSTTGGDLAYRRTVVSQWGATQVWYEGNCYVSDSGNSNLFQKLADNILDIDFAQARPIDEPIENCEPPIPSDPPVYNAYFISRDRPVDVQINDTATFDLNLNTIQNGDYQLQFQMVNLEAPVNEQRFGDVVAGNENTVAKINVRVGEWGLNCTASGTVIAGQNASYAINATGNNRPGSISVTMASNPAGPAMTNSPLVLDPGNSYAGVATVSTSGLTPGRYALTFSASGASVTCPAEVVVNGGTQVEVTSNLAIYMAPDVNFAVNGSTSATIAANTPVTLTWTTVSTNTGNFCFPSGSAAGNWTSSNRPSTPGSVHSFTTTNLPSGNYTFSIYCEGYAGVITQQRSVTVTASDPPSAPTNVNAANAPTCGQIQVTWTSGGTPPNYFEVYHQVSASNPPTGGWGSPIATITYSDFVNQTPNIYPFRHTNPSANNNYYMVRAISTTGGASSNSSIAGPAAPQACAANISTSDKDVISLQRGQATINSIGDAADDCSSVSEVYKLPNNGLFRTGDVVTFQINVCNTGNQTLTGVSITDTLANLSNPTSFSFSGNCGSVAGTSGNTITMDLVDIAPNGVCAVTFKATITAPSGPAALYRFQNVAAIASDQASLTAYTPPYLFQIGGGVPVRNETQPQ